MTKENEKTTALIEKLDKANAKVKTIQSEMEKWLWTLLKKYYKKTKKTHIDFVFTVKLPFEPGYTGIEFDKDFKKMRLCSLQSVFYNQNCHVSQDIAKEILKEVTRIVERL